MSEDKGVTARGELEIYIPATRILENALNAFKTEKPNDRSDLDRRYAVVITEIEKVFAYAYAYIESQDLK